MGKIGSAMSMSLDGYITGPDETPEQPLGRGGEVLFAWYGNAMDQPTRAKGTGHEDTDNRVAALGALICGRIGYEVAGGWGDEPMFRCPIFVLTHTPREPIVKGETTFTFVTEGFDGAVRMARDAAGDKDIALHGSGVITQGIDADILDELRIDLVPVLLGEGKQLFAGLTRNGVQARVADVTPAEGVTHLTYRFD